MISSTPSPHMLAEIDLCLVHALQISPRVPWSTVGRAIGVDPATAARRWRHLADQRLAWFVVAPSAVLLAPNRDATFVQITCLPGRAAQTAARIATAPNVLSVDLLAGRSDLSAIVLGRGLADLQSAVDDLVRDEPAVVDLRTTYVASVHVEDPQWRLSVLSVSQRAMVRAGERPEQVTAPSSQALATVTEALALDARMSLADLGRQLGTSEVTARRILDRSLRSQAIHLGCDVVADVVGAGRSVLLEVSVDDPHQAGTAISKLPQTLRCATVVGAANLMLVARFASLSALAPFESTAAALAPGWRVLERSAVTSTVKRQGRLLDERGRVVVANDSSSR